ncbi:MAG: class I SAM-dependent DNA methyltransferase [Armatimonadetes bacterium]|nr:class I SAM-dependent DNA methyltransferase [Armatimonadota bacterium]
MTTDIQAKDFIARWAASSAHERGNAQSFFGNLCDLLGVGRPEPATADYCFEKPITIIHRDGHQAPGYIDFHKRGHFVIEAKQGSETGDAKIGTARRGTQGWHKAMQAAFGQAHTYAMALPEGPPPFLITCDIGHVFEVWKGFSGHYGGYGARKTIELAELVQPEVQEFFRLVFTDPPALDPSLKAAKVTREVAGHLAELARELEPEHGPEATSAFLMRCIFTMFAEDVALIPADMFTHAIQDTWLPAPESFQDGVTRLWESMDKGLPFGFSGKLLRFNGGLFASTAALPLTRPQLERLLEAARCDWALVEPTIFGTLVERALDPAERERLGAHFTPREYIERLVRPAVIDPLRDEWMVVLAVARQLVDKGNDEPTEKDKAAACEVLRDFLVKLCKVRILDPACGSGNFLYVTFALMKALEWEVIQELKDLGDTQVGMEIEQVSVNPSQFAGLESNPRAREIADLVLWIGYLQWHRRARGEVQPVEPVLREYKNIICADAVLTWEAHTDRLDDDGNPVTVWDMRTYKESPVTGERVPDEYARAPVFDYTNAREATWPEADFVVSNPPFVGGGPMRKALGDGYAGALRKAYPKVGQSSDLVMYWWDKAAQLTRAGKLRRFGFISTNSITQTFNRRVLETHLTAKKNPLAVAWAIPDHPWVDGGADVRIAMTVGVRADRLKAKPVLGAVTYEEKAQTKDPRARNVEVRYGAVAAIHADLTGGVDVTRARPLRANLGVSCPGVKLHGAGFIVTPEEATALGLGRVAGLEEHIRPYRHGRDLAAHPRGVMVIDLFGLQAEEVRTRFPAVYQWVAERVKPDRDTNKRATYRNNWWIFGEPRADFRPALAGLSRYIATPETARRRWFVFLDAEVLPDNMLVNVALADAYHLGVLSSHIHVVWALRAGGRLGVGNDPRYNKTRCFDPFPFPTSAEAQKARIRTLAEQLNNHREQVRVAHAAATITNQYAALERLRQIERVGGPPTAKERSFHAAALIGVLKSLHDDLDAAVAAAYGWPVDLDDEVILERLVALNAVRAAEEAQGQVRWLRPDFQAPEETRPVEKQVALLEEGKPGAVEAIERGSWPKGAAAQLAAVRDLLAANEGTWTVDTVAGRFIYAHKGTIRRHLDTLEVLGLLVSYGEGDERRWTVRGLAQ